MEDNISWLTRMETIFTGKTEHSTPEYTRRTQAEDTGDTSPTPSPLTLPDGISLLHTLSAHTGSVGSLAWSPDGTLLASGGDDGTVRLWHPAAGSLLHTLSAHTGWVRSLAWSPDSALLASGGRDDTVRLWRS